MSRRVAAVLLAAVAATGLAACDSGGGTTAPGASSSAAAAVAPDKANPAAGLTFSFTGSDGVQYGLGQAAPCGMIPNDLTKFTDVPPGETVNGTVCEVVPTGAINGGSWLAAAATGGMKLTYGLG